MSIHILLSRATRRPYRSEPEMPAGAHYVPKKGYWMQSGIPLMNSAEFVGGRTTKKCDQETGEDQKGE